MREHEVCYGICNRIYPPQTESAFLVRHYARVEKLIHFELMGRAMWMELCPKNQVKHQKHREWFEVERQHAIAVITKWSDWMNNSPYEEINRTEKEVEVKRGKRGKQAEQGKEAQDGPQGTVAKGEKESGNHEIQAASALKVWRLKPMSVGDLRDICSPVPWKDQWRC